MPLHIGAVNPCRWASGTLVQVGKQYTCGRGQGHTCAGGHAVHLCRWASGTAVHVGKWYTCTAGQGQQVNGRQMQEAISKRRLALVHTEFFIHPRRTKIAGHATLQPLVLCSSSSLSSQLYFRSPFLVRFCAYDRGFCVCLFVFVFVWFWLVGWLVGFFFFLIQS